MRHDPIIEELHQMRQQYAEKFSFDLDAMFADLKHQETQNQRRKISRQPKNLTSSMSHQRFTQVECAKSALEQSS